MIVCIVCRASLGEGLDGDAVRRPRRLMSLSGREGTKIRPEIRSERSVGKTVQLGYSPESRMRQWRFSSLAYRNTFLTLYVGLDQW